MDLREAAAELAKRFGTSFGGLAYLPGKTAFRDVLCERCGISQLEAEELCDSLEQAGMIHFERDRIDGSFWTIERSSE